MDPVRISTEMNMKHCTLCQRETEYYCRSCQIDLCQHCKATHAIDLNTRHHEVMFYRKKFKYLPESDVCVIHSDKIYNKYCVPCEIPVCDSCSEHKPKRSPLACFYPRKESKDKVLGIEAAYKMKRQHHKQMIHNVRNEILYKSPILLKILKSDVNTDVETCQKVISQCQSKMIKRGQGLKDLMDGVLFDDINKHGYLKQKNRMTKFISTIQIYEQRHEQSANRPVTFLRFLKNTRLPQIQDTPHLTEHYRLSLNQEINTKDLIELLSKLQITEGGKRKLQAGNELLLTLLPSPVLQKSTIVEGIDCCYHISCVTPDRVWVSDNSCNLIFTDTTTLDKLHSVEDSLRSGTGFHTVNSESELIYIDKEFNIKKRSSDMKTTTTIIKKPKYPWYPQSVYCSPSSGDLLVGMWRRATKTGTDTQTGEVRRYNNTGKQTQTIPHNNTPHTLYSWPLYITENNNGDVVVADDYRGAVVVTDCGGRLRFAYTGPPSGSRLQPSGICTDALSHILVCDANTDTVQMINKDGEFLSYLLTKEKFPGFRYHGPVSLSYDVNTHVLCVGSGSLRNKLSVFRYIDRHPDLTDGDGCDYVNTSPT